MKLLTVGMSGGELLRESDWVGAEDSPRALQEAEVPSDEPVQ